MEDSEFSSDVKSWFTKKVYERFNNDDAPPTHDEMGHTRVERIFSQENEE